MSKIIDRVAHRLGYAPLRTPRRNFKAGKIDRLTASWTITSLTSDETLRRHLRVLRARSREMVENNDYARRFLSLTKSNVVGPKGIAMQARTLRQDQKTPDEVANVALEEAWRDWGLPGQCDITGGLSWTMAQGLFLQTVATDGEVLVRKIVGKQAGPRMFTLQFLDPELLDINHNESLSGGRFIRMGIEFDKWSRPAAYHIHDVGTGQHNYSDYSPRRVRIPAAEIIHSFLFDRVGQKRGLPWMSTAMMRLQMLGGYEEAALTSARVGASKMGFFSSPDGDGYTGADTDSDGSIITEANPGTFEQLPNGVDFKEFNPAYPSGEFKDFVKAVLRGAASGLGVSYNTLANDLEGVNFSSIRAGVLEDREVWKALQNWMVEVFCIPLYRDWLRVQLAFGLIRIGKNALRPDLENKYQRVVWQPRRWSWVDPLKDMRANAEAIDKRLRSTSDVIREQGRDPDEVFKEIAAERVKMEALNILPEPAQSGFLMPGGTNDQAQNN